MPSRGSVWSLQFFQVATDQQKLTCSVWSDPLHPIMAMQAPGDTVRKAPFVLGSTPTLLYWQVLTHGLIPCPCLCVRLLLTKRKMCLRSMHEQVIERKNPTIKLAFLSDEEKQCSHSQERQTSFLKRQVCRFHDIF